MSIFRWIYKEDVIYITYTREYCSAIKKEWKNAICSNMDDPRDYYTKWNKSDRERQKRYQLIWNIKKLYKWIYLQHRNRDRKQT